MKPDKEYLRFEIYSRLLVLLITSPISFWISSFIRHTFNVWTMSTLLSIILITISPTFYPYTYLPHTVLYAMTLLPTTSAAMLEQGMFNLAPMNWYPLIILIVETVGFFFIAKYLTKWCKTRYIFDLNWSLRTLST